MTDYKDLQELLLQVLCADHCQTTAHLAEELRAEFPADYNRIINAYRESYSLSTCSIFMSPFTVVGGALNELAAAGLVERKYTPDGTALWRLAGVNI